MYVAINDAIRVNGKEIYRDFFHNDLKDLSGKKIEYSLVILCTSLFFTFNVSVPQHFLLEKSTDNEESLYPPIQSW